MFQNLKVDIVYYKTNTDFEMEFNLCGCCRMRLLTDKAPDSKSAVRSLSRAVSRSRVILVIGALFGDDGVINLVSKAIDSKLSVINNKSYGISGNDEIKILAGSTPLVTKDGYFGGCIIECGPQTMILLTENKTIRKELMKLLIHPYIEELCAVELNQKATATKSSAPNEIVATTSGTLAGEYGDVATELFTEEESASKQEDREYPELSEEVESDLLFNDEPDESESTELDDEYERIDEALYINEENPEEQENYEDLGKALLVDDATDDENQPDLDDEYQRMANALYTESGDIENEADEIDPEISEGVEVALVMDQETPDTEQIDLSDEYEDYASTLYTDSNTEADSDRDPDYVSETTQAEQEAMFKSGLIYENQSDESVSPEEERAERYNKKNRSINRLNWFILIMVAFLLVVLAILCYSIFFVPAQSGENIVEYIKDIFNTLFGK